MQLITRIKYKDEKLTIQWQEIRGGHRDKKTLESKIEPHQDFVNALFALDKVQCLESELSDTDDEMRRHDIQQVDLDYDEDEVSGEITMSASITSERFMESASDSMKVQSPMKPETSKGADVALNTKSTEKIYELVEQAKAYLGGKRHDLFSLDVKVSELTAEQAEAVGN